MRRPPTRRLIHGGVVVLVGLLLVAGCGGGRGAEGTPHTVPADSSAPTAAVSTVRVGLVEWAVELSSQSAAPGALRLRVTNAGATEHDLTVTGREGTWRTEDLAPAESVVLIVRAAPGETLQLQSDEPGQVHPMHARLHINQ